MPICYGYSSGFELSICVEDIAGIVSTVKCCQIAAGGKNAMKSDTLRLFCYHGNSVRYSHSVDSESSKDSRNNMFMSSFNANTKKVACGHINFLKKRITEE
jgi:hypothetical protein